jgi:hypothetical protein
MILAAATASGQSAGQSAGETSGQAAAPATQVFPLTDTKDLTAYKVKLEAVEYQGRKAVHLTQESFENGFALLSGTDFQDGTIEVDLAVKVNAPPGVRMPGFIGVAFRARPDTSHFELFYLRPRNARADDQAMRNHSVQYSAAPDYPWYRLRREWPSIYETYIDLQPETWTHVKIDVKGRTAALFVNGSTQPALIVDGLKGDDLRGGVALSGSAGQDSYFANVRITHATPQPVKNGGEAAGSWQLKFPSDAGVYEGTLQLRRDGNALTGTWSGAPGKDNLGQDKPVTGSWRDGYVELTFPAEWPKGGLGAPGNMTAALAGWIDGDSAKGRMRVDGRADGPWTATRTP